VAFHLTSHDGNRREPIVPSAPQIAREKWKKGIGIIAYRGPSVQIRDLSSHLKQVEPVVKPVRQNHAHTVARTNGPDAPSMLARQLRQVVFRTGAMSGAETVALRRPCAG
jgi:hypothetical protein